jgi:hypothetical protein
VASTDPPPTDPPPLSSTQYAALDAIRYRARIVGHASERTVPRELLVYLAMRGLVEVRDVDGAWRRRLFITELGHAAMRKYMRS